MLLLVSGLVWHSTPRLARISMLKGLLTRAGKRQLVPLTCHITHVLCNVFFVSSAAMKACVEAGDETTCKQLFAEAKQVAGVADGITPAASAVTASPSGEAITSPEVTIEGLEALFMAALTVRNAQYGRVASDCT